MKIVLLFLLLFMVSSASGEIYMWRDGAGVFHYSNSLDDVPLRHREKVKVMNYGPVQKVDSVPPQAAPHVAPSVTQTPATGISSPRSANGGNPAREGSMLQRQRRGVERSTSGTPDD